MDVVISGKGIVSALGIGVQQTLDALLAMRSGVGTMRFLASEHKELPVGEVPLSDAELKAALGIDARVEISRTALMAIHAVRQALSDAELLGRDLSALRIAFISGTTVAGMDITERHYDDLEAGRGGDFLRGHDCGASSQIVADFFGIFADVRTISTACSSAANALILGANMLKAGQADIVIAGGSEALSVFHLNGFNSLMILDHERCRPFDASRAGLNLGEGAAYVVLESKESAEKRNAHIAAHLTGYGNACDAFHQTATSDNGDGPYLAMAEALKMANLQPQDISYVNAHGTGTPNNDKSESIALTRLFGNNVPPFSSTKAFTGHTTSASGSIESVICLLAMDKNFLPPSLGFKDAMEGGLAPVANVQTATLENVMCNAFGFGGNDSSLILSRHAHPSDAPFLVYDDNDIVEAARVEISSPEDLTELSQFIKPMEARRMGPLMKASLLSSLKALKQADITTPDAIITGTYFGLLDNSAKLMTQLHNDGEKDTSPTLFMQSTHNTLSGAIAIRLKCHGYNITYSQGSRSLECALQDARLLLRSGRAETVLVGCHDESSPLFRKMTSVAFGDERSLRSVAIVLKRKA